MGLYPKSAGAESAIEWSDDLLDGLEMFPQTQDLVTTVEAVLAPLEEAFEEEKAARKPRRKAKRRRNQAELDLERGIRRAHARCREKDGERVGPVTEAVFKRGLTPEIAPKGASQVTSATKLVERINKSKNAGVQQLKPDLLAILEPLTAELDTKQKAFEAAWMAWRQAQDVVQLRKDEHRRTCDGVLGGVRQAFPGDRATQRLIIPSSRKRGAEEEEELSGDEQV